MRTLVRNIFIFSLILYFLPMIVPGFKVEGGFFTFLFGTIAFTLMHLILRPILSIISFPINAISLGLFSIVINTFILYLVTVFIDGISVVPFTYPGAEFLGFIIPVLSFSLLMAYIYTSFVLSCIDSFLRWMMR